MPTPCITMSLIRICFGSMFGNFTGIVSVFWRAPWETVWTACICTDPTTDCVSFAYSNLSCQLFSLYQTSDCHMKCFLSIKYIDLENYARYPLSCYLNEFATPLVYLLDIVYNKVLKNTNIFLGQF